MFLNKLVLAVALFFLLERITRKPPAWIALIASASFAIFFIHPILILVLSLTKAFPIFGNVWADLALASGLIVVVALVIAVIAKRIFGDRSRYLLGY